MVSALRCFLFGFACCLGLGGCLSTPNWNQPGTVRTQQYRAMLHDPYADNDIGPEVVGGRPRDYDKPLPAPVRHQPRRFGWFLGGW